MPFSTWWGRRKPNKKSKKGWCARISCDIEGVYTIGLCISRFLSEKDLFYVNLENWDRNTPSNSPKAPGTKSKFGKERVHREVLSKSVRLMSVVLARRNSRTDHMRKLCTKKDAPAKQRGIWRKTFTSSRIRDKATFKIPGEAKVMSTPITSKKKTEEREFVVDSGASIHMID